MSRSQQTRNRHLAEELERTRSERDEARRIASENVEQCRLWHEQHCKRMDQIAKLEKELEHLKIQMSLEEIA